MGNSMFTIRDLLWLTLVVAHRSIPRLPSDARGGCDSSTAHLHSMERKPESTETHRESAARVESALAKRCFRMYSNL